ncbi:Type I secretion system ATP-binding protein PrsD [Thauera sp. GDN1]|uniref:type I secretion system permease/ATPase n=1 Tax=Thauera sp. GDN1 TaxID=2944810 RepID=UPI002478810C|nr:type I secretion system permease/ATPase [Thauera sp. GDN1]WEN40564.1 Type I secretion system ATP-binding protein PrsD [Thauera sp. GDN1]
MNAASPAPASNPLRSALQALRGVFLAVGSFSFVINLLMLMPTLYMLQVYDRVLSSRNEFTLLMLTLIMVGVYALEAALEWVRSRVLVRASSALDLRLGGQVFDAAFRRYLGSRSGNPGQALGDLSNLRQFLTGKGLLAFFDAPWAPIYLAVIFLLSPWLGLFGLVAAALLVALAWANEKLTAAPLGEANRLATAAGNYAGSNLRNAEVIEAMGMLGNLRRRWQVRQAGVLRLQAEASERAAWVGAASRFTRLLAQSGILGLGALLVLDNQLTAGGMIAGSILLGRALAPVDLAIGTWRSTVSARGAHARLAELLSGAPAARERTALPRPQGLVLADNLVLAAPGSRNPVVKGVSFGAKPGMLVAVIGPSASGKSSLARGLVGVWPPLAGSLRLDNAKLAKWDKEELGPWLGYLPQDVELFEGTVAENIARFGERDDARIVEAARRAGVHDMILHLPEGYDTPIGERGLALSGGQRQRIGLARALYGSPALVVLDEPNANLDEAGDAALLAALQDLRRARSTVFVMTHRLNLLAIADAVMILADGAIKAYGPRDAIFKSMPALARAAGAGPQARIEEEAAA